MVMTISQGGTGSGGSGDAIRKIYQALYGVDDKGAIDNGKALLPTPQTALPKFNPDGTAILQQAAYVSQAPAPASSMPGADLLAVEPSGASSRFTNGKGRA